LANCLSNIVGIKGCSTTPSGVYVQQLTGISIAHYDQAINNDHKAAFPALQEKIDFATGFVLDNVRQYLATKYQLKSFIENETVGYWYDDKQLQDVQTGNYVGIQVKLDNVPHMKVEFGNASLFTNYTGSLNLLVIDLIQGKAIDTIEVDSVAGEVVTFDLNKYYYTNRQRLNLFIGYDASTIQAYKTSIYNNGAIGSCGEWCDACFEGGNLYFRSASLGLTDAKTNTYVNGLSGGAGLSLNYSLQCSFDEYLCSVKSLLAYPVLYKVGAEIMREMRYSKRLSGIVTGFVSDHAELIEYYENEHLKMMSNLFQNMKMPQNGCLVCEKKIKTVLALP